MCCFFYVQEYDDESNQFFKYDGRKFTWTELPEMKTPRRDFGLVHHEGFIYAVGGRKDHEYLDSVERFNLGTQKWDRMYELTEPMIHTSTAVVNGKIFVCGMTLFSDGTGGIAFDGPLAVYAILVFDPVTETWTLLHEEDKSCEDEDLHNYVLVVQDAKCYRVWHEVIEHPLLWRRKYKPHVNPINIEELEDGDIGASLGEEIRSEGAFYPADFTKAFAIEDQVYVIVSGYVHKIGTIKDGRDMDGWSECSEISDTTVVEYTFHWKELMDIKYGAGH